MVGNAVGTFGLPKVNVIGATGDAQYINSRIPWKIGNWIQLK